MQKVWLKNYPAGIPHEIKADQYNSLAEMFDETVQRYKHKPAFANLGTELTYGDLDGETKTFAAFCQKKLKLQKGDRLGIMLPNLLQYPIVLFGALRAGLTVVNINPLYTPRELEFQLKDSGCRAMVVLSNFAHTVEMVRKNIESLEYIIVTQLGDCFPWPKSALANFVVKYIKKLVPDWDIPGYIPFNQVIQEGAKLNYQKPEIKREDPAFLQYTGGTTGVAKGAILTHGNMLANLAQALSWVKSIIKENEIIITALPLYHIFSLTANCILFFRLGALNVLITNPRDIQAFVKEVSQYPFTAITGVNTLFNALLYNKSFHQLDFSHLHLSLGGGMALQRAVADRWKEVTGCPLLEAYGLTETAPAVCINPLNLKEFNGSIGLPIPSTEISIRDDNENELGFNTPGELWVKGPQVTQGYWNRRDETEWSLKNGWLRTGDIATIDEEGFLRIVDRKKDMILVSGFNVYPNEVEDVIALLPGVKEVAVIGIPDGNGGEKVKAYIVRRDPALTAEQIIQHCRTQLTPYKVPKEIEFRENLPKTNIGKILRRALKEESRRLKHDPAGTSNSTLMHAFEKK